MTEKEFLKLINGKRNINGEFTYTYIYQLLNQEELAISKKPSIIKRFFNRKPLKSAEQIIEDNFEQITNKMPLERLGTWHGILLSDSRTTHIISGNIDMVLSNLHKNAPREVSMFIRDLRALPEGNDLLETRVDYIINRSTEKEMIDVIREMKGISEECDEEINEIIKQNKEKFVKSMIWGCAKRHFGYGIEIDYGNVQAVEQEIDELVKREKIRLVDIHRIGSGANSETYKVGSKVIKIHQNSFNEEIPQHPRILEPDKEIQITEEYKGVPPVFMEISDFLQVDEGFDLKGSLYEVYRDLRRDGYIWTDAGIDNLRTKDGKAVIIDRDYIFNADSPEIRWGRVEAKYLEKRYQQEIQADIAKAHQSETQDINIDRENSEVDLDNETR